MRACSRYVYQEYSGRFGEVAKIVPAVTRRHSRHLITRRRMPL